MPKIDKIDGGANIDFSIRQVSVYAWTWFSSAGIRTNRSSADNPNKGIINCRRAARGTGVGAGASTTENIAVLVPTLAPAPAL